MQFSNPTAKYIDKDQVFTGNEAIGIKSTQVGVKGGVVGSPASGVFCPFIYSTKLIWVIFACFCGFFNCVLGNEAIGSIMSQVGVKGGVVDSQASGVLIIFIYSTNSIRVIFACFLCFFLLCFRK